MLLLWVVGGASSLCGALSLAELAAGSAEDRRLTTPTSAKAGDSHAGFLFGWSELILIRASALGAHRGGLRRIPACAASASIRSNITSPRESLSAVAIAVCRLRRHHRRERRRPPSSGASTARKVFGTSAASRCVLALGGDHGGGGRTSRPRRRSGHDGRDGTRAGQRALGLRRHGATCRSRPARSRIRSAHCRAPSSSAPSPSSGIYVLTNVAYLYVSRITAIADPRTPRSPPTLMHGALRRERAWSWSRSS